MQPCFWQQHATGGVRRTTQLVRSRSRTQGDAVQSLDLAAGCGCVAGSRSAGAAEMQLFGGDDEATELNELEQQFLI